MKGRLLLAATAAAAALSATAGAAPAQPSASAQRDWSQVVSATPEGGFRMGNPDAPVKLVEFVSLTCPHCRRFAETAAPALVRDYVRSGRVSFEIRAYPLDVVASLAAQLNRCAAPSNYFALNDAMLAAQDSWFSRLEALPSEQVAAIERLPDAEFRMRVAAITELDALAANHGLPAERVRACLADEGGARRVAAIKAAAEEIGVQGTPSFTLNGRLLSGVHDWPSLEPLLRPPGQ